MFSRRSSVAALQGHVRGIEHELRRLGQNAGRHSSGRVYALRQQIAETIAPILEEVSGLLRTAPRLAGNEAERFRGRDEFTRAQHALARAGLLDFRDDGTAA